MSWHTHPDADNYWDWLPRDLRLKIWDLALASSLAHFRHYDDTLRMARKLWRIDFVADVEYTHMQAFWSQVATRLARLQQVPRLSI